MTKGNVNKRVRRDDEDKNLGAASDVVVEKAALVEIGEIFVNGSIPLGKQKPLEHVVSQSEENDKGDGENEGREGGQGGNAGDFHFPNVSVRVYVKPHGGKDRWTYGFFSSPPIGDDENTKKEP